MAIELGLRLFTLLTAVVLISCARTPDASERDPTKQEWYGRTVDQLVSMNREAENFFANGKGDQAAAVIGREKPLMSRVLSVREPTLAAVEAASDLDDLYGRMLFSNRHYGWARLEFQKNLARWKHRQPQTPDSIRRLKRANDAIAECDRHLEE
jgi:hypothetical protein